MPTLQVLSRPDPPANIGERIRDGSLIAYLSSVFCLCFSRQCNPDQAANCFRARGLVILLLGPAFNPYAERLHGRQFAKAITASRRIVMQFPYFAKRPF